MDKKIWLVAGVFALSFGTPAVDARSEVNINIGIGERRPEPRPFVFEAPPRFLALPGYGFSVAVETPYDVILYRDNYFVFRNGVWYNAPDHRGPWVVIQESRLPRRIRRYQWDEIRRSRDIEYRRYERHRDRHNYKDERGNGNDRGWRNDDRGNNGQVRGNGPEERRQDDRRPDDRRPEEHRPDQPIRRN